MNSGSQEPPPSGHRYDVRSVTEQFEAKRTEIKSFVRGGLDAAHARRNGRCSGQGCICPRIFNSGRY
jgi:hypothetical protein